MKNIEREGCVIHYDIWGDCSKNRVVVLVHSKKSCSSIWFQQVPYLVQNGFCCIVPDMRGFGRSIPTNKSNLDSYHPKHFPNDIVTILNNEKINKPVDVICLALGGWAGLPLACFHPEIVASLMLVGSPGGYIPEKIKNDRAKCQKQENNYSSVHSSFYGDSSEWENYLEDIELAPGFANNDIEKAFLFRMICKQNDPLPIENYGAFMYEVRYFIIFRVVD